jgi:hypothetical protein
MSNSQKETSLHVYQDFKRFGYPVEKRSALPSKAIQG